MALGNPDLRTKYEPLDQCFRKLLGKDLVWPFRILFAQPATQVLALFQAYLYGVMYLE